MSIIYLDTSALLKLYVQEAFSDEVKALLAAADAAGTSILTYTETASAMARAARMRFFSEQEAKLAWEKFLRDWPSYSRLKLSAQLTERAAALAWEHGLRGYDAMHLATALAWQETLGMPIILATFDRLLWTAGENAALQIWPEALPAK